jgi:hypothetical protein
MNYGMPSAILLVWLAASSAYAEGGVPEPDPTDQTRSLEIGSITPRPRSSWESWLRHDARGLTPTAQVPPANLEFAAPTTVLTPSTAHRPEFIGPELDKRVERQTSSGER